MNANTDWKPFLARKSFIELRARDRARAVLDEGSFREILGPFDRLKSPWLGLQGIVAQADDGVVIGRGTIAGQSAVIAAIEGAFQGGSMGEVAGAKIAGALELALRDCENGTPTRAVLLLETGGVRLQEANLGLAAIAEIHAGIVALRRHVPVVGVIAGLVGCFGGMSLAAALCSYLIVTREARLGMNGPEVIEQEAGIAELNAADRTMIWDLIGGTQRSKVGMVDRLIIDDANAVVAAVQDCFALGVPKQHRTEAVDDFLKRLAAVDTSKQYDGAALQAMWPTAVAGDDARVGSGDDTALSTAASQPTSASNQRGIEPQGRADVDTTSTIDAPMSRGRRWLTLLSGQTGTHHAAIRSVLYADAPLGGETVRFIAVVPDPQNHFPRARAGEVGLEEGWTLARIVRDTMREAGRSSADSSDDRDAGATENAPDATIDGRSAPSSAKRPIIAIVDVSSQAYGRREELMGVHIACAAAADAYADARLSGHPVIALIVGKAMSGAFLAHGYQANRIIALDDPGVLIHAMGQAAAARVTRRTVEELVELGARIPPMSYDVKNYAKLGLLSALLDGIDPDRADGDAVSRVSAALSAGLADIRSRSRADGGHDLSNRYASPEAQATRRASIDVRRRLAEQW